MKAYNFLNYPIEDNQTSYGGKSNADETLGDFLADVGHNESTDMELANIALTECGCEPIPYSDMKNCRYAVRFPEGTGIDIIENASDLYFADPKLAFESADRMKAKYNLETIDVEDIKSGMWITTVGYTEI